MNPREGTCKTDRIRHRRQHFDPGAQWHGGQGGSGSERSGKVWRVHSKEAAAVGADERIFNRSKPPDSCGDWSGEPTGSLQVHGLTISARGTFMKIMSATDDSKRMPTVESSTMASEE